MSDKGQANNLTGKVDAGILEKPILSNDYVYEQAMIIAEEAQRRNVTLRLLGATAFINHCPAHRSFYTEDQRQLTDIDFMTYSRTATCDLQSLFAALGYQPLKSFAWHSETREIYVNEKELYVDIFKDVLNFCHPISFKKRLELDYPTITVSDMLLEKLQIVEINEKDLKDVAILLTEHELEGKGREVIDMDYICRLWCKDWGFYYTATMNLTKLLKYINTFKGLTPEEIEIIMAKIKTILERVEAVPKKLQWKIRAKIGTKVRWYNEVESMQR